MTTGGIDFRQFWGKAQPHRIDVRMHPVAWHCLDVAAVFQGLCRLWPDQAAALSCAFEGADVDTIRALSALVALHDLGKFTWTFQAKAQEAFPTCLGAWESPPRADHTAIGYGLAEENAHIASVAEIS
jgi:CRISPR-associated endonuclease/helicase Cas3